MSSWHRFTGRYEKRMYQVKLPDGYIILAWPNAGKLNAMDGTGREFTEADGVEIRPAKEWA